MTTCESIDLFGITNAFTAQVNELNWATPAELLTAAVDKQSKINPEHSTHPVLMGAEQGIKTHAFRFLGQRVATSDFINILGSCQAFGCDEPTLQDVVTYVKSTFGQAGQAIDTITDIPMRDKLREQAYHFIADFVKSTGFYTGQPEMQQLHMDIYNQRICQIGAEIGDMELKMEVTMA